MRTSTQKLMGGVATALLISAGGAWAQTDTAGQGQSGAQIQQTTPTQQGDAQSGTESGTDTGAEAGAEVGTQVQQEQPQPDAEAQTDAEAETQTDQAQTEAETDTGTEAEAEQQTDTQQQTQETTVDVDITAEQETTIKQEIRATDVDPIDVDFDVAVGVSVPGTVVLHPLPTVIIDVVPAFVGYVYFVLVDGRIAVVHPDTHVIVAVV